MKPGHGCRGNNNGIGPWRRRASLLAPLVLCALATFVAFPADLSAQGTITQQLRDNEDRLSELRSQRSDLESVAQRLRGRVHEINAEIENLEQRKTTTGRMVNEIDRQISVLTLALDTITVDLIVTEDALEEKKAVLERRLSDIYKRGSLWAFQVLMAAESFGNLLHRYKYLYLIGRQDRALAADVQELRDRIAARRNELITVNSAMRRRRSERGQELSEFRRLQNRQQRTLASTRQTQRETQQQLETIDRTENQIQLELVRLEEARRDAVSRGALPLPATITADDIGNLPWPVEGTVVHGFGLTRMPNNTEVIQNGIGIRTPTGTPVRAVAGGQVVVAMPHGTYGFSVWILHGGGFYTLYLYLSRLDVVEGELIDAGDRIGLSGGERSEWGAHIEFQIRGEGGLALNPANWLRPRR